MHPKDTPRDLGIADRLRRTRGRAGRRSVASTKVTRDEQQELEAAAKREGKVLSEWAREVLLSRARKGRAETATFTEVIALRMLLNRVLGAMVTGEQFEKADYDALHKQIRNTKHATAEDVLTQYQIESEGEQ